MFFIFSLVQTMRCKSFLVFKEFLWLFFSFLFLFYNATQHSGMQTLLQHSIDASPLPHYQPSSSSIGVVLGLCSQPRQVKQDSVEARCFYHGALPRTAAVFSAPFSMIFILPPLQGNQCTTRQTHGRLCAALLHILSQRTTGIERAFSDCIIMCKIINRGTLDGKGYNRVGIGLSSCGDN